MVTIVVAILAGLVLLSGRLQRIPAIGPSLERFARWLVPFEVALGVIAIIVGLLELLSLEGILLILAGLILAVTALRTIPAVGPSIGRLGSALAQFRWIIGAILLAVGILDLLLFLLGSFGYGRLR
jgi:cadmium resistance protein CadD (predicted permease)